MTQTVLSLLSDLRFAQAKFLASVLTGTTADPQRMAAACDAAAERFPGVDPAALVEAVIADREPDLGAMRRAQAELSRLNAPDMTYGRLVGARA